NFGRLVPGRAVGPTNARGFTHPSTNATAANHGVFAAPHAGVSAPHQAANGHVFAQPAPSVFAGEGMGRPGSFGGSRATAVPTGGMRSGAGASSVHSAGAASSGGAHK